LRFFPIVVPSPMNNIVQIFAFYFESNKNADRILEYNIVESGAGCKLLRASIELEEASSYREVEPATDLGSKFRSLEEAVVAILIDLRGKEIGLDMYPELATRQNLVPYKQKAEEIVYRIQKLKLKQITIYGNLKKYPPASVATEALQKKWRDVLYKMNGVKAEYNGIDEINFEEFVKKEIATMFLT
jgi:hypothetical protein